MIASDADSDNGETGSLANSSQGSCSPPVIRLRHYTPTNPMIRTLLLASIATIAVPAFAHDATAHMAKAASSFLESLTPEQKTKATFAFKTEGKDERFDWHFVPKDRKGLPLKEMTEPQRKLAKALLKTGLSADGYQKAETIQS